MTTLRGIAQLSDCLLTHMLLVYWRKLLVLEKQNSSRIHRRLLGCFVQGSAKEESEIVGRSPSSEKVHYGGWI
jgi:hypothetical protein